jgi:hypothetical protein
MGLLVSVILILLALVAVVGVMAFVLNEKHDPDGHKSYVRSPWREEHARMHAEGIPHDHPETVPAAEVAEAHGEVPNKQD